MGGKALVKLGITSERIDSKARYRDVCEGVVIELSKWYAVVRPCFELAWKETFGDIDVLVAEPLRTPFDPTSFGSLGVVRNGNVCSFEFMGHQVDVIVVPVECVPLALFVAFAELGMCLGPLLKRMGLKLSLTGLYQRYEVKTLWYDLLLTEDLDAFLEFLGLGGKPLPYLAGSYQEIFDYIRSGNIWFDDLVRVDTLDTERNRRERPMYVEFRKYCLDPENAPAHRAQEAWPYDALRNAAFFGKTADYLTAMRSHEQDDRFRTRFNGHIVSAVTGLRDKELGAFMRYFLEGIGSSVGGGKDAAKEVILAMTAERVIELVEEKFASWHVRDA
jgi:hypothetical protein